MTNDLSETHLGNFREKSIFNGQLYILFLELFQNGKINHLKLQILTMKNVMTSINPSK